VSRLQTASGEPFATGEARWNARYALAGDKLPRLFVQVEIEGLPASAVVDTGGAYLILNPEVADRLRLGRDAIIHRDRLLIRGMSCWGTVYRVPITLPATAGEPLTFEATAFVPELEYGETWPLPSYLGWQGCLDRIRFAVDPADEVVYFGAVEADHQG
jgi:hypothetical protein